MERIFKDIDRCTVEELLSVLPPIVESNYDDTVYQLIITKDPNIRDPKWVVGYKEVHDKYLCKYVGHLKTSLRWCIEYLFDQKYINLETIFSLKLVRDNTGIF